MRFKRTIISVWAAATLAGAAAFAAPDGGAIVLLRPAANPVAAVHAVAKALHAGNPDRAARLASLALDRHDLQPDERARVLLNRGFARQQLGNGAGALADFTAALAIPGLPRAARARAWFNRGVVRDRLGHPDQAIADYTAALKLAPKMTAALNNRANAYRRLGHLAAARRDYEASLAAGNPTPQFADYGLGQIAEIQGHLLAAQDYYRSALAADPDYVLARQRLAALGAARASVVLHRPPRHRPSRRAPGARVSHKPAVFRAALRPAILGISEGQRARVQLGAYRSERDAAEGWDHLVVRADGLLAGLTPRFVTVDLPGRGRFYRLRAGPVARGGAKALCRQLKARGLACFAVRD